MTKGVNLYGKLVDVADSRLRSFSRNSGEFHRTPMR